MSSSEAVRGPVCALSVGLVANICVGIIACVVRVGNAQVNDFCINATAIGSLPYSNTVTTTIDTVTEGPPASCQPSAGRDAWWSYTPASNANVTFSTCNSNFDTVLTLFTGDCSNLTEVNCNDDFCGAVRSSLTHSVFVGTTYLIRVAGYNESPGLITLNAALSTARPANDLCTNATVINSLPYSNTVQTTTTTTAEGPAASCQSNAGHDIWWTYTPAFNQTLTVSTCNSPLADTVLTVFTGSCGAPVQAACSDNDCNGGRSTITLSVAAGTTYRIRAAGFNNTVGVIVLQVSAQGAPCATCYGDMNGDNFVNGSDIAPFVTCLITGAGTCGCTDFDASGGPDALDVPGFVSKLMTGGCP